MDCERWLHGSTPCQWLLTQRCHTVHGQYPNFPPCFPPQPTPHVQVLNGPTPEEVGHVLTAQGDQGPDFEAWIKAGAPGVGLVVAPAPLERAVAELGAKAGAVGAG